MIRINAPRVLLISSSCILQRNILISLLFTYYCIDRRSPLAGEAISLRAESRPLFRLAPVTEEAISLGIRKSTSNIYQVIYFIGTAHKSR